MSWHQQIIVRLPSIIYCQDIDGEVRFKIDMQTKQFIRNGMSPKGCFRRNILANTQALFRSI
jgi:hypothetical protein